jgi:hypothetical protein
MSDTQQLPAQPAQQYAEPIGPQSSEPRARTPWRERVFGLRAVLAVALAGVILGGLAGWGITAAASSGDSGGRFGGGPGQMGGGPGQMGRGFGPGGQQGQMPGQMGGQLGGQQGQVPGQQPASPGTTTS